MRIDSYVSDRRKRQKKRRIYFFAIGIFLVAYFMFLGAVDLIIRLPAFQVERIVIQGNNAVSQAQIMDLLQASVIRHGDLMDQPNSGTKALLGFHNMLIWPNALPSSTVAVIPQLSGITISKDYFLHTITVTVAERQPFGIWCLDAAANAAAASAPANESCFWFDNDGTIFSKALDTQGGAIIVVHDYSQNTLTLGGNVLPQEFMPELVSILNVLQQSGVAIQQIALNDIALQEIDVTTVGGPVLRFSLQFSASEDLSVLENLMAMPGFDKLQYVDFTVQNRAYYK